MALEERYGYVAELGRGGTGRVLACVDRADGERPVALKVVAPEHLPALLWELSRLRDLRAPQLAEVLDLRVLDAPAPPPFALPVGAGLLVQARAPGAPAPVALASVDDAPATRLRFVHGVGRDALLALRELHRAGLVHRDVKPQNLVVSEQGSAVLVDLELAVPAGPVAPVAGTPAYLPPEAFSGMVGPELDVFAVGATLFDLLVGADPGPAGRNGAARGAPREVDALPGFVPTQVRALLARWLSPWALERPADASAALSELEAAAEAFGAPAPAALAGAAHARTAEELAARALSRPWVGPAAGLSDAIERLARGGVLQVCGPPGAGRSRLAREATLGLQLRLAEAGEPVPEYLEVAAPELPEARSAVVCCTAAGSEDLARARAWYGSASVDGGFAAVVLEVEAPLPDVPALSVPVLEPSQVARLLESIFDVAPPRATVTAAHEASAGLAGIVCRQVARGLREGRNMARPAAWRELEPRADVRAGLGPAQVQWLHALSLWDAPVDARTLGAAPLSDADREQLARVLAERGLLRGEGDRVQLTPGGARALRRSLDASQRAAAARALEAARGERPASPWLEQGAERVALLLRRVSELRAQGAVESALYLLEEAQEQTSDAALRLAHVDALRAAGRYEWALALLARPANPEERFARAELLRLGGQREAAEQRLEELAAEPGPLRARALVGLSRLHADVGSTERAEQRLEEAGDVEADAEASRRALELWARIGTGRVAEDAANRLFAVGVQAGSLRLQARASSLRAARRPPGDARARAEWLSAFQWADHVGEAHEAASYAVNLGLARLDAGELGGALEMLREGARRFAALERPQELGRVLFNWANAWLLIGEDHRASFAVERAERESRRAGDVAALSMCALLRAERAVRAGAPQQARRLLEAALQEAPPVLAPLLRARLAFVLASLDQVPEARAALPSSRDAGASAYEAEVALSEARVALAEGALESAEGVVRELLIELQREGSFELRLRGLLLGAEVARAARAHALAQARLSECRQLLDTAMRGLSRHEQLRLRQVEQYARAFDAVPATAPAGLADDSRWRRVVAAVPRLFRAPDVETVGRVLCELALELVPAERALWLVRAEDGPARDVVGARWPGGGEAQEEGRHSESIVSQAYAQATTVSAMDAVSDARFGDAHSVRALSLRSVIAVPLRAGPAGASVLYLEDRLRPGAFGAEDAACLEELSRAAEGAFVVAAQRTDERRAREAAERRERSLTVRVQRGEGDARDPIVGRSQGLRDCLALADRVAQSDLAVLIRGESGTGKELIARRIHAASARAEGAFVAESCAALPETLLESALFGHVRGAFTGASRDHRGLFEQADGGTLFLDEIGEMSAGLQAKLLRVLETGEVRPVGGQHSFRVDARLLSATHRDLLADVHAGRFREDLYYRVAVVDVHVPALRERREDVPELVQHFMQMHAPPGQQPRITTRALLALQQRDWRGNVRELENAVRRALVLTEGEVDLAHVQQPDGPASPAGDALDLHAQVEALQRRLVRQAMAQADDNQTRAAELLGVSRYGLQKMLKRFTG